MKTKEEILSEKLRIHGYNLHNILHTKGMGMMNDMLTIAVDAMEEYHTQFSLLEKTETVTTDHSQLTQPTASNCANHKKEVAGISDMKLLAEMIGDLHYESLKNLFFALEAKFYEDHQEDGKAGRKVLAMCLYDASIDAGCIALYIQKALEISKPFMQDVDEEFDVVVKPDFKTTTVKATVTSVQDATDINDFVSTEKNFNAELNRAVRSFLPLPKHRQIEIWTSMGYVGTWEHNSAENNKPFFNWIIENKKQVDFISAVKIHSKTTSNQ
jgi:hypothetical protein